ncbi:hypothetical protein [Agrobacterium pusense]|jgi:hypothetical protein|uniref:hypothetical protein n=1 Tax=Agrobacterium pusense TaxID=648995 RepID=UPI0024530D4E|nr:hypothetical protein [Agrobacterium pusense]
MSAIDRIGGTAALYTHLRPQEVTHTVPGQAAERPVATSFGGAPAPLSSNLANALWSLEGEPAGHIDEARLQNGGLSPEEELSKWAHMSLGEKIRAQYLEARGLTESDLTAMSPDERKAIEDEIKNAIVAAMNKNSNDAESRRAGI